MPPRGAWPGSYLKALRTYKFAKHLCGVDPTLAVELGVGEYTDISPTEAKQKGNEDMTITVESLQAAVKLADGLLPNIKRVVGQFNLRRGVRQHIRIEVTVNQSQQGMQTLEFDDEFVDAMVAALNAFSGRVYQRGAVAQRKLDAIEELLNRPEE